MTSHSSGYWKVAAIGLFLMSNPCVAAQHSAVQHSVAQHRLAQKTSEAPHSLQQFQVEGKIAFYQESKGGNASIFWQQKGNHYHIRLVGALGAGSLEIFGRPGFVGLVQSNGESYKATDPEQLVRQVLGWDIPVSPLRYWLQGQMVPNSKSDQVQRDHEGKLISLHQLGWSIQYEKYMQHKGKFLPTKITLRHGPIRLKFVFRHWRF